MSDTGPAGSGWFHAEGDPPGTVRYWDGVKWIGAPHAPGSASPPGYPPAAYPPAGYPPVSTPGGGPTAHGTQPMPLGVPPKKSSTWKWVVGVLLGVALLVGGGVFLFWRSVSGPIDAGNNFLAELQQGDFDGAWALSEPSCFDGDGRMRLERTFSGVVIESYDLSSTGVDNTGGTTSGLLTIDGNNFAIELRMVKRDGWRVCGYRIDPVGGG